MSEDAMVGAPENPCFECDCADLLSAYKAARLTGDLASIDVSVSANELVISTRKPNIHASSRMPVSWRTPAPDERLSFTTDRRLFRVLEEISTARAVVTMQPPDSNEDQTVSREWIWLFSFKREKESEQKEIEWPFEKIDVDPIPPMDTEGCSISVASLRDMVRLLRGFSDADRSEISQTSIQIGEGIGFAQPRTKLRLVRDGLLDTPSFRCSNSQAKDLSAALESLQEARFHSGIDSVSFFDSKSMLVLTGNQKLIGVDESTLPMPAARVKVMTTDFEQAISKISSQSSSRGDAIRLRMSNEGGGNFSLSCLVRGGEAVVTLPLPDQEQADLQQSEIRLRLDEMSRLIALPRADQVTLAFDSKVISSTQELDGVVAKSLFTAWRGKSKT